MCELWSFIDSYPCPFPDFGSSMNPSGANVSDTDLNQRVGLDQDVLGRRDSLVFSLFSF